jgi:Uncharacterized protein conserved in bacteria C-term(DUF2220)
MKDLLLALLHLAVMTAKLCGPGGVRAVIAENLLVKQQLIVLRCARWRAPNLALGDRLICALGSLFLSPGRIRRVAIGVRPSTLLAFHQALVRRKCRRLFSSSPCRKKPGPKGLSDALIQAIDERSVKGSPQRVAATRVHCVGRVSCLDQFRRAACPLGDSVLFIENQITFERATWSTSPVFSRLALVFASGFKGSSQRLRTPQSVSIYYSQRGELDGAGRNIFETWLGALGGDLPVYFWGDLDWSGMRILRAMRGSFPQLRAWEPGYVRMRNSSLQGAGHSPEAADKKGQLPLLDTGCSYADAQLLPALRAQRKFLDQELFAL